MGNGPEGGEIQIRDMEKSLKLLFISRSDMRGGAAVVTYRLVLALRELGMDARMLVCDKMSKASFVEVCAPMRKMQYHYFKERFYIRRHNGFDRKTLPKIDSASEGMQLWKHPLAKKADAIFLGQMSQGMLSVKGLRKLMALGKPLVWIMHDMWNMTGICHHAGGCTGFLSECAYCPLLGKKSGENDLSHKVWQLKKGLYAAHKIRFVAVSTWLASKAKESRLMKGQDVEVIPNAFSIPSALADESGQDGDPAGPDAGAESQKHARIIFGAARLDDPIKGLPVLRKALEFLRSSYPEVAADVELVTFGAFKDIDCLRDFAVPHVHLGLLKGAQEIRKAYESCDIVVSTSDYETLPGTLVEGQAFGCIPVAISHGGQKDIVEHLTTGWLAPWNDSLSIRAGMVAEGIAWAYKNRNDSDLKRRMRQSVDKKFQASEVALKLLRFTFPHLNFD